MKIEIKHRWSNQVMFTEEAESLRDAVIRLVANRADLSDAYLSDAYLGDANLSDANLRGADLSDANLRGANLSDANLRGANLRGADLRGADLSDANLRGANLRGAYLSDAYLSDAYLGDANLRGADLSDANLRGANLRGADLRGADLSGADLSDAQQGELTPEEYAQRAVEYRERNPDVPVVPLLDATVCKIVNSGEGELEMGTWHSCETTHCRAGWAIHLAGKEGYALEEKYDSERAGAMIYKASTGRYPDFFASNEAALADICARGAIETESVK